MRAITICTTFILLPAVVALSLVRYPVGEAVPVEVYTAPFDPCDAVYKFLAAPPEDWTVQFGNNERTVLIHAISELRIVVATLSRRLIELEERVKALENFNPILCDPNEVKVKVIDNFGKELK